MDAKGALSVTQTSGPAVQAQADVLAFAVLGDPAKDAVFNSVDQALGGALLDFAKTESFEGKAGQTLVLYSAGKIPAKRVVVVGGGAKNDFANPSIRDVTAAVAQTANKVGAASVAFVLPALGGNREPLLVQM